MKIFLIGLPGSGKTFLGKELARAMNLLFVDLDKEIEKVEGKPIKEIFKGADENYFREVEARVLRQWCQSDRDFVMATGGGAPCFFDNLQLINQSGKSVFLDVPAHEIVRRMMLSKIEDRPLLAASGREGLKDKIEFMRSSRIAFYNRAHILLHGETITAGQAIEKLK
jgi:shikimate kinase